MREKFNSVARYSAITIWLLFTVSLISWWLIFAFRQLGAINQLSTMQASLLARQHSMLMWEGGTLLLCVIGGGAALMYSAYREIRLSRQLRLFFLSFAHEIKTPLASLRLQAESLQEDLQDSVHNKLVERLVTDTARLSMRLENSIFFTNLARPNFCYETIRLNTLLESCRQEWPDLKLKLASEVSLQADKRALEAIFNNLMQNSIVHGHATQLTISPVQLSGNRVSLLISDNGAGFQGDQQSLGRLFIRPSSSSGSGLGLYLVRELAKKMGGEFSVLASPVGFAVELTFRGQLV